MPDRSPVALLRRVRTDALDIAYYETGPPEGDVVLLPHGFPYAVHSYGTVAPLLAEQQFRVIVPHLRGRGPTTFLSASQPRSGRQAALGADAIALLDALGIERACVAGFDWGGRAANVAAALWPERILGLVSVNSYLIQDISAATNPLDAEVEAGLWYFFYFLTERGRAGLAADPRGVARVIWKRNSPRWRFTEEEPARTAEAFANPDYTDVVIHSYRHRLGFAPGAERYAEPEFRLAELPGIPVPAVTLEGMADGNFPATNGSSTARYFTGPRLHRQVAGAGHNLPQECPHAFAEAVRALRHHHALGKG